MVNVDAVAVGAVLTVLGSLVVLVIAAIRVGQAIYPKAGDNKRNGDNRG